MDEGLAALVGSRTDKERLGYARTEHGALVDCERMSNGPVSSTEVAIVHIARACAVLERGRRCPTPAGRRRRRSGPGGRMAARRLPSSSIKRSEPREVRSWRC